MADVRERVLDLIQSGFPLDTDPYGAMGAQLGVGRQDVLAAVAALRADGSIRRLGASFASKRLGYSSTLCALAVPGTQEDVDRAAEIVNAYPNVTHNYLRDNRYNLWFTIIARGPEEVARILREIEDKTGVSGALNLPATALYKIKVDFGEMKRRSAEAAPDCRSVRTAEAAPICHSVRTAEAAPDCRSVRTAEAAPICHSVRTAGAAPICHPERSAQRGVEGSPAPQPFNAADPVDVALVRWAQEDIAGPGDVVDPAPFATAAAAISAETGVDVDEGRVVARLRELKQAQVIRRFGALVAHRKMGYAFNGMTVWDVPDDRADDVGKAFAAQAFVSHCYARPRSAAWPYNLYAMVHAQTQEELDARVVTLERACGLHAQVLVSTREYKKTSMRYFTEC